MKHLCLVATLWTIVIFGSVTSLPANSHSKRSEPQCTFTRDFVVPENLFGAVNPDAFPDTTVTVNDNHLKGTFSIKDVVKTGSPDVKHSYKCLDKGAKLRFQTVSENYGYKGKYAFVDGQVFAPPPVGDQTFSGDGVLDISIPAMTMTFDAEVRKDPNSHHLIMSGHHMDLDLSKGHMILENMMVNGNLVGRTDQDAMLPLVAEFIRTRFEDEFAKKVATQIQLCSEEDLVKLCEE